MRRGSLHLLFHQENYRQGCADRRAQLPMLQISKAWGSLPGASTAALFHVSFCLLTAEFTFITGLCGLPIIHFLILEKEQLACSSLYKLMDVPKPALPGHSLTLSHLDEADLGQRDFLLAGAAPSRLIHWEGNITKLASWHNDKVYINEMSAFSSWHHSHPSLYKGLQITAVDVFT